MRYIIAIAWIGKLGNGVQLVRKSPSQPPSRSSMRLKITLSTKQAVTICLIFIGLVFLLSQLVYAIIDEVVSCEEVARVTSPDKKYDAVLIETNGGVTTGFGYLVYILPHKQPYRRHDCFAFLPGHRQEQVGSLYDAIRNENSSGANLNWLTSNQLIIEYLRCEHREIHRKIQFGNNLIHVVDKSGVVDTKAPAGGMGYSLHSTRRNQS